MNREQLSMSRRQFIAASTAAGLAQAEPPKKKVAAIVTLYVDDESLKSHAAVVVGRLLNGYTPNAVPVKPRTQVVSMYTDQVPDNDLSRELSQKHGFTIYPTIKDALTLGGDDLAVDAVCLIGEHGDYPSNERGQKFYPRYELFEQIVEVFRRTGKIVPVFSDKHFSYSWLKAKQMYRWKKELGFPLMTGSSIPVTVRVPELEIPFGADMKQAVMVGRGGLDGAGFHTIEAMQCMVERRAGGETGIQSVEWLEGAEVWRWRDSPKGRWSIPLLEAALERNPSVKSGRPEDNVKQPVAFLLNYRDGLQVVVYMMTGHSNKWTFAGKIEGQPEPVSTHFGFIGREGARPLVHFDGLVHCMEEMFVTGKPCYPVERTLLTSCALSLLFESRAWKKRIETSELDIRYQAPKDTYFQRA